MLFYLNNIICFHMRVFPRISVLINKTIFFKRFLIIKIIYVAYILSQIYIYIYILKISRYIQYKNI